MRTTTDDSPIPMDARPRLAVVRDGALTALTALLLAACSPAPTPTEPTPVPEDEPTPQVMGGEATGLRDAIQAPQDKARAVEDTLMQAAHAQREAIDAAENGDTATPDGG